MLWFILSRMTGPLVIADLNTSYVMVHRSLDALLLFPVADLNTSYVMVHPLANLIADGIEKDLNTSYVMVHPA